MTSQGESDNIKLTIKELDDQEFLEEPEYQEFLENNRIKIKHSATIEYNEIVENGRKLIKKIEKGRK